MDEKGSRLSVTEQGAVLQAFSKALRREAHVLTQRPDLLWQQMYNRLQWEGEPVTRILKPELHKRNTCCAAPWLRTRTPLRDSDALLRTLAGHTGAVTACAISPNGTFIVSASEDTTLMIWDAATGAERATLAGHTGAVTACAISPDGTFVVSASDDKTLKVWDASTAIERATFAGHTDGVTAGAISPAGSFVVQASKDTTLVIWDAATGVERATLRGSTGEVVACAISPDGAFVVAAYDDDILKVWDAATAIERATLAGRNNLAGNRWTSGPPPQAEQATLAGHTGAVTACAISPDGTFVVPASGDKTLMVWDAATGAERATLAGHTGEVTACAISPDGAFVFSASEEDNTLKVWDAATGAEWANLALPGGLWCLALHSSRPFVACGDGGGGVHLIELVGIDYGSILTTAIDHGTHSVRCPACRQEHQISDEQLGGELTCPTAGCGLRLKVNPFIVQRSSSGKQQPAAFVKNAAKEKRNWLSRLLIKR